jgi:putative hemolysin
MDDVGRLWINAAVIVVAVVFTGFLSACETIAGDLGDIKLKKIAEQNKKAECLVKLTENSGGFLAANFIARAFTVAVLAALGSVMWFSLLKSSLVKLWTARTSAVNLSMGIVAVAVIVVAVTLIVGIFGVSLPRKLCRNGKIGERFLIKCCGFYSFCITAFKPLEITSDFISRGILRLFGISDAEKADNVTEEEILMMVDAVNETGGIEESQAEMISNIFEFDDTEVGEVMTHRTEIAAIEEHSSIKEAAGLAIEKGVSRVPVYKDSVDDIIGVIFVKDLLTLLFRENAESATVKDFMRDIMFVPESKTCGELFKEFSKEKVQIAVAVDEYGGTAGLVTMEDLLETIVGSIQDEYDNEKDEIVKNPDGSFDILGNAGYEDVMEALGKQPEEDSVFETVGAMVIDLLGRIPEDGETPEVTWENVRFSVLKAEDKRIEKIRAVIL